MAMRSKLLLAALFLVLLPACTPSDDVIPSAQAAATAPALYPPLSADAEDGNVHEYY